MSRSFRLVLFAAVLLSGCKFLSSDSSDASLSALVISSGTLSPAFSATVLEYSATVDSATALISVSAIPGDGGASVSINGQRAGALVEVEVALDYGANQITVSVLSENRKRRAVYTIAVTRLIPTYSVGGSVSGLTGSLTLQNNGGDDLEITADGAFTFATELDDGSDYAVTVSSQPSGQECSVTNGTGTLSGADVTDVSVSCSTDGVWRVGGSITGIVGTGVLQLNGGPRYLLTQNGTFAFGTAFPDGADYEVTVQSQPSGQTCTVTNGTGTFAGDNAFDVAVECTGAGVVTGSIFDWEWINPLPQGNGITQFASNGTRLVAIGAGGLIQSTTDGTNWTRHDAGISGWGNLMGITWGGGRFVVVSDGGSILTSADGVTWQTAVTLPLVSLADVSWNGSVYVAAGYDLLALSQGLVATSSDGTNWTTQTFDIPNTYFIQDVVWNGTVFAAVSFPDYVHTSADGVNWTSTQVAEFGAAPVDAMASNGSRFVAIAGGGVVFTSDDDGATWVQQVDPLPLSFALDVQWDGSRFVATGLEGYATSPDGSSWTGYIGGVFPSGSSLSSSARFSGLNILGLGSGAIYTSPDDASWTTDHTSTISGLWDVIWAGGQFVAVGQGAGAYTSPDGATWTGQPSAGAPGALLGVTFGGGQYVAVRGGTSDQIVTSPDAMTWTSQTPSMASLPLRKVAWGNSLYVAVGSNGLVMTSPDGTTWTEQTSGFDGDEQLYDVAWNGSIWATVGYQFTGGTFTSIVATSVDGIDWVKNSVSNFSYFQELEWNGSVLLAAGPGAFATSTDGVNWSILQTQMSAQDITWSGSEFIVAGYNTGILSSADGQDWTLSRTRSGTYLGIAANADTTVLVNYQGNVLRRGP